jgi:hypothetical protein
MASVRTRHACRQHPCIKNNDACLSVRSTAKGRGQGTAQPRCTAEQPVPPQGGAGTTDQPAGEGPAAGTVTTTHSSPGGADATQQHTSVELPNPQSALDCLDIFAWEAAARGTGLDDQVVVKHPRTNIPLTGTSLRKLQPGRWLNDELINAAVSLLQVWPPWTALNWLVAMSAADRPHRGNTRLL